MRLFYLLLLFCIISSFASASLQPKNNTRRLNKTESFFSDKKIHKKANRANFAKEDYRTEIIHEGLQQYTSLFFLFFAGSSIPKRMGVKRFIQFQKWLITYYLSLFKILYPKHSFW